MSEMKINRLIGRTITNIRLGVASDSPSDPENHCADVLEFTLDNGDTFMLSAFDSTSDYQFPEFIEYEPHEETVWLEPLQQLAPFGEES